MAGNDHLKGTAFEGFRVLTEYAVIEDALRCPEIAPRPRPKAAAMEADTLLKIHGERHKHRRRLEGALFRPETLRFYERDIFAPTIARVLDEVRHQAGDDAFVRADLVRVAQRLVMQVTGSIIGLDDLESITAADDIYDLMVAFTEGIKVEYSTDDQTAVVQRSLDAKQRYWDAYIRPARDRRAALLAQQGSDALPTDLLSLILLDDSDEEAWDDDLLLRECILYLVGAGATTVSLSTHAVVDLCGWLDGRPEDRCRLSDEEFIGRAIAESFRLHPPFVALIRDCPVGLATKDFKAESGETLFIDVATANRDESVFGPNAAAYDPHREVPASTNRYGLSFGFGRHLCIGLPLAAGGRGAGTAGTVHLMVRAFFDAGVRLDPDHIPRLADSMERRYEAVPVIFDRLTSPAPVPRRS